MKLFFVLVLAMVALGIQPAHALTIDLGDVAEYLQPVLITFASSLAAGIAGWLALVLKKKWGLEVDANQREAFQTAAKNSAQWLIVRGGEQLKGRSISIDNPLVAEAVKVMQASAGEAIKHFDVRPEELAQKILSKLPEVTDTPPQISSEAPQSASPGHSDPP